MRVPSPKLQENVATFAAAFIPLPPKSTPIVIDTAPLIPLLGE
jgi:hypothetical protein